MRCIKQENSAERKPLLFVIIFYICSPVLYTWVPGYELAATAFFSLGKLILIQLVAEMRKTFPRIRIWPLYVIAAGHIVIATSALYLKSYSSKFFYTIGAVCTIAMSASGYFMFGDPRKIASSENSEVLPTHNDGKGSISV